MMHRIAFVGDQEIARAVLPRLEEAGYSLVSTLAQAEIVITYDASLSGLEDIYLGEDGIVKNAGGSTIFVDLSPTVPSFSQELYQLASVYDSTLVAAPLIVKNPVAKDALEQAHACMIVAGGEQAAYDTVVPLLRKLATQVFYVGSVGDAQSYKVSHTVASAAAIVGAVEAYSALSFNAPDADFDDLCDILLQSGAVSEQAEAVLQAMHDESFAGSYQVSILMAELAVALGSLEEQNQVLPQADAAFRLLELLALAGGAAYNPAALMLAFADEETGKRHNLDWDAVQAQYGDGCGCGHDHSHDEYDEYDVFNEGYEEYEDFDEYDEYDDEDECCGGHHHHDGQCCGKHHHDDDECCGGHHHHH